MSQDGCRVVAVVSGGPDSIGYMARWLSRGCRVHVLTFNYGQKPGREIEAARRLVAKLAEKAREMPGWGTIEEHRIVDMEFMASLWQGTQLTDPDTEVTEDYHPTVIVPLRNVVMLAVAAAYAYTLAAQHPNERIIVAYGAQYDDTKPRQDTWEPRYPDSTPECTTALQAALHICHFRQERRIEIRSPAAEGLTKAENLKQAHSLIEDLVYETWSCYRETPLHCGRCESCKNRHKAFFQAGIPDCTPYQHPPGPPQDYHGNHDTTRQSIHPQNMQATQKKPTTRQATNNKGRVEGEGP